MTKPPTAIKPATLLAAAGRRAEWTGTPGHPGAVVNPAVWRASTHLYPDVAALRAGRAPGAEPHFYYGTHGGPTQWALAEALTAIEPGAAGTILYPSGLAAVTIPLLAVLRPGDVLLMADNAYGPSRDFARDVLGDWGVETRWFDPLDLAGFEAAICPHTSAVLLEAPGSLTMEVCDIPALAAAARARHVTSILDNTWATSLGFAALARGVDISVTALSKHAAGHSDILMGSASAGPEWFARLQHYQRRLGLVVSPDDAALALRGLRTMAVRLDRSTASALAIAEWLAGREEVAQVLCPMLPGAPGHALWQRDFTGGCGLFSFVLRGGTSKARDAAIDALHHFGIGYSWGGFESLATPLDPASQRSAMAWPPTGCGSADRFGIRLSVGLEDAGDLIADLDGALAVWASHNSSA